MTDLRSNNEFDSLESFFHEKLRDASFAKAEGPWKQIEEELERMEKEKRKRRFFWFFFSGLALLGGMAALWFFVLADRFRSNEIALRKTQDLMEVADKKISSKPSFTQETDSLRKESQPNIPSTETLQTQTKHQNAGVNEQIKHKKSDLTNASAEQTKNTLCTSKIQLAASSNKADPAIFKKIPFAVIEVEGKDGIIRYFAETEVNNENLQVARSAGFASAFVKKNFSTDDNAANVKESGATENTYIATKSNIQEQNSTSQSEVSSVRTNEKTMHPYENTQVKQSNNSTTDVAAQKNTDEAQSSPANTVTSTDSNNNIAVKNENPVAPRIENSNAVNVATSNTTSVNNEPIAPQATAETTKDSVSPVAIAEAKKDSIPKKVEEKDSSKIAVAEVTPTPFTAEWAILLLAGPNIFTSHAESNLYQTSSESQPASLNTELKVQFRPTKLLSFSGGVNYTTYSAKQDRTGFRFNKYQTSDYIFYSAFGPMSAPMSTLLEGYSMQAPFDTFPGAYSQNSKLNMLNIPLEANLHFLSKSRIGIYLGLGANSSFVVSQRSTLTLHKEHFDNTISYNKVTVSPFGLSLLFSLGCDVRVGKRLYLSFVPSYRYGVTNMSTISGTTFSPAYLSGNAGLKFKF